MCRSSATNSSSVLPFPIHSKSIKIAANEEASLANTRFSFPDPDPDQCCFLISLWAKLWTTNKSHPAVQLAMRDTARPCLTLALYSSFYLGPASVLHPHCKALPAKGSTTQTPFFRLPWQNPVPVIRDALDCQVSDTYHCNETCTWAIPTLNYLSELCIAS